MRFFLKYIELILTAAGLLVIAFFPSVISDDANLVASRAITASIVGVLHGIIFFVIRHRQRQVREETIREISQMLRDIVNNQLTIISLSASKDMAASNAIGRVQKATKAISGALESLSEESLYSWKRKYQASTLQEAK